MEEQLYIVSLIRTGTNYNGDFEFEARYSDDPENVWGDDFAEQVPSVCPIEGLIPFADNIRYMRKITVPQDIEIEVAAENSCFSMQDCIDGIIKLAWINNGRSYTGIPYGETIETSDMFFNMIGATLSELTIVNSDPKPEDGDEDKYVKEGGSDFDF